MSNSIAPKSARVLGVKIRNFVRARKRFRCPYCGVIVVANLIRAGIYMSNQGHSIEDVESIGDKMDTQPERKSECIPTPIIQPMHIDCEALRTRPLPRADGGKDAWLVLAGCFVLEVLVWGYII
jgi:hypothetical protein